MILNTLGEFNMLPVLVLACRLCPKNFEGFSLYKFKNYVCYINECYQFSIYDIILDWWYFDIFSWNYR